MAPSITGTLKVINRTCDDAQLRVTQDGCRLGSFFVAPRGGRVELEGNQGVLKAIVETKTPGCRAFSGPLSIEEAPLRLVIQAMERDGAPLIEVRKERSDRAGVIEMENTTSFEAILHFSQGDSIWEWKCPLHPHSQVHFNRSAPYELRAYARGFVSPPLILNRWAQSVEIVVNESGVLQLLAPQEMNSI